MNFVSNLRHIQCVVALPDFFELLFLLLLGSILICKTCVQVPICSDSQLRI